MAVADHAVRYGRYAYRIEFSLSGQEPYFVTFESPLPAVALSISDIDHDNDVDVLVTAPLSGQTLDVWLNDGSGHFTAAKLPTVVALTFFRLALAPDPELSWALFVPSPRRTAAGTTLASCGHPSCSPLSLRISPESRRLLTGNGTQIRPRAPPLDFPATLS